MSVTSDSLADLKWEEIAYRARVDNYTITVDKLLDGTWGWAITEKIIQNDLSTIVTVDMGNTRRRKTAMWMATKACARRRGRI